MSVPGEGSPQGAGPFPQRTILIVVGVIAVCSTFFSCCCCGGVLFSRFGGADSRLVGTWEGKHTFLSANLKLNFKSNGRYEWKFRYQDLSISDTGDTGSWKLTREERNHLIVDTVSDAAPDNTVGWTFEIEEDGQVLLKQPGGSFRLKRK